MDLGGTRLFVAVKAPTNRNILAFPPGFGPPLDEKWGKPNSIDTENEFRVVLIICPGS